MMRLLRAPLLIASLSLLLFLGVGASDALAEANNPPATEFPAEGTQIIDDKGKVTYWFEQSKDYGAKAIGISALGSGTAKRPQYVLNLSNGRLVCTIASLAPSGKVETTNFTGALNDCAFTYTDTGHVRVLTPNLINGAIDRLFDGPGPDAKLLTIADGGVIGKEDAEGNTVVQSGDSVNNCSMGNIPQCFLNIPGYFLSAIGYAILVLSTFILFLAGTVFNWVVIRTVFQFATYFGTSEGMLVAWTVLRDIANIALLFGFVFIGVATILNTQSVEGYSAKKALPRLIIFAVLLNFSLFATQGIIDVANGFASIFSTYAGQECGQAGADGTTGDQNETCANEGISGKIMSAAGMNHMFSTDGMSGILDKPYSTAAMLIILSILVSITAMVLFAASIMLVIRVVVLSLLMVTSPIGFAGLAIPSLNKIAQDWWHRLINQAFFAPLYLLMVFISLKLVDGLQTGGASLPQALTADVSSGGTIAGNMQVVVVYAIVIGFMVGSLMVAQKMGAAGAGFATKTAGGLAFGAQGFVGRRTVGRLSAAAASKVAGSKWAEKNPSLARLAYGGLNKGATASFSARNMVGGAMKGAGAKLDIGSANKTAAHGYHGIEEKAEKDRLEFAKKLTERKVETPEERTQKEAAARNTTAAGNLVTSVQTRRDAAEARRGVQATLLQELSKQAEEQKKNNGTVDAALQKQVDDAEKEYFKREKLVGEANLALDNANRKATEVRATESKLKQDITRAMSAKGRQESYANAMKDTKTLKYPKWVPGIGGHGITLAGHANHLAAEKILKNANKSDVDRALDTLKESMKEKKEEPVEHEKKNEDKQEEKHEEKH